MIYTTGTIAGNGNTLTGTGTNFAAAGTLIRNGCTVIVLSTPAQVFQITGVNSATQLAVTPAVNPAIPTGTRYAILLSDSLSVDGLALNVAETLNMYLAYMSGFADVMTGTGNVTITINGVSVTVPTQKSLVQKGPNGTVPVTLGGTGGNTPAAARAGLELGSAATKNIHTQGYGDTSGAGVALQIYSDFRSIAGYDGPHNFPLGVTGGIQDGSKYGGGGDFIGLLSLRGWVDSSGNGACWQMAVNSTLQAFRIPVRYPDGYTYLTTYKIWNQRNTTVDGNGFIKQASPIARLTSNPEAMPPTFTDGGFSLAGVAAVNLEAEGVTVERVDTGVYKVRGALGLHSDGWTIEIPQDSNGNRLCFVETGVAADGVMTVSVFKRRFDIDTAMIVAGEPMDIPEGRWIDLRLEMPADSIYNQQMKAAEEAMIKEQAALAIKDTESVEQSINTENQ